MNSIKDTVQLNNGVEMPLLGLGVFLSKEGSEVINAVKWALEAGYRHIDTAAIYQNEEGVGQAIRESEINREDVFVVSKLWNSDQGFDSGLRAFDESLKKLKMDYLDLYLIHWPVADKYKDSWKALEKLYRDGRVKSIGVSNFMQHHLEDLLGSVEIMPMVNQMEFHPYLMQDDLREFCKQKEIQYESWSPLMQGKIFEIELLNDLAGKYNKSIAQLVIRWNIQKKVVCIPKSSKKERIIQNANIYDFNISEEDMLLIDSLDTGTRVGPDPDNFDF